MAARSALPKPASEMYEEEAQRWEETGKLQESASNDYAYTKIRCWLMSSGAEKQGVSERLQRYFAAIDASFERWGPDWFDDFLRTKDWCSYCGESFRLENLSLCTHCDALLGYCHSGAGGTAPNGNPKCPRCNVGEIVG